MPFLFGDSGGGSSGSLASISNAAFSNFGGAVSDLFAASGDRAKAQGDLIEAQNYDLASTLALQNEQFTQASTAIRQAQIEGRDHCRNARQRRSAEFQHEFWVLGTALEYAEMRE